MGRICAGGACEPTACAGDAAGPSAARAVGLGAPVARTVCANGEDWLAFSAGAGSPLDVSVLSAPPGLDFSLVWFEPGPERVRREQRAIDQRLMIKALPTAAARRYFLRVTGDVGGDYVVLPKAAFTACTDPLSPSDSVANARNLPANTWFDGLTACSGRFYSVDVPANHALSAYAFLADGDAQVALFNADGSSLSGVRTSTVSYLGGGRLAEWDGSPAATRVIVRVTPRTPQPSSVRLYFATSERLACGNSPLLLDGRADRARADGTNLAERLGARNLCGDPGRERSFALRFDDDARLVARVGAPFGAVLSLRDAACSGTMSCIAAVQGVGVLDLPRVARGDYVLTVGGAGDQAGPFDLALRRVPVIDPPANDRCGDGAALTLGPATVTVQGSTEGASPSGGALCDPLSPDVFYSFTVDRPSRLVAEVRGSAPLSLSLVDAGCAPESPCPAPGTTQRLDRQVSAGTHQLRVASTTGVAATFTLRATLPAVVANDRCDDATSLAIPQTVTGDTTWATNTLSFPLAQSCTGYYTDGNDVFYSVNLTAGRTFTATLTPSAGYDPALYVVGSCAAPQCLAGVDVPGAGVPETLRFTPTATGTYHLVVSGAAGGGPFTLHVE
ncbi:Hypothetical protein AKJ08_3461 [Vulgatibacter incomptus]|uniref:Peptidase C-terminal archaeal/bacterial domain-containing protein n=2 Tax=Vulgatibacter incomptus TaxID=1391653 RepID=A0A0K1PIZ0_9BACT|nr:Hypothetical protein AKJ08_3461 [Vulgatibacter incomptus]